VFASKRGNQPISDGRLIVSFYLLIINNPDLREDYRKIAIDELIKKCEILVKGYSKHGKGDVAQYYRDLIEKYKKI